MFSIEYPNGIAYLSFVMINSQDCKKKTGSTGIELAGINDRSPISTLQIIDFKYKDNGNYVWPL
jgi:hypothetical protein